MGDTNWYSSSIYSAPVPTAKPADPIKDAPDDVLIFELIERGYAVAKMRPDELANEL